MSFHFPRLFVVTGLLLSLSACSWLGKGERRERYLDAEPGKDLQVPPSLDVPDRRDSMRVPEAGGELVAVSEAPVAGLPLDADDPQSRLKVRGAPDDVFQQILVALEQAQIASIGDVDAVGRRIALRFEKTEERKRWWSKDGTRVKTIIRSAHVVEDPVGSRVVVEEDDSGVRIDDEYAQRVLSALRDRIQWE
jgi:hypothetical protein